MKFQRARTDKQIYNRQEEIINACEKIYSDKSYKDITFTAISKLTSISRPAIYSYYKVKDEILLDLLKRELEIFLESLEKSLKKFEKIDIEKFSELLTEELEKRKMMLKLFSIYYTLLLPNSRIEKVIEFKKITINVFKLLNNSIKKFFNKEGDNVLNFEFLFFTLILSIYPITSHSEKTKKAMESVNPDKSSKAPVFKTLCYEGILALMKNMVNL